MLLLTFFYADRFSKTGELCKYRLDSASACSLRRHGTTALSYAEQDGPRNTTDSPCWHACNFASALDAPSTSKPCGRQPWISLKLEPHMRPWKCSRATSIHYHGGPSVYMDWVWASLTIWMLHIKKLCIGGLIFSRFPMGKQERALFLRPLPIALKAAILVPILLLQRPARKSKAKDHSTCLERQLNTWLMGDLDKLLKGEQFNNAFPRLHTHWEMINSPVRLLIWCFKAKPRQHSVSSLRKVRVQYSNWMTPSILAMNRQQWETSLPIYILQINPHTQTQS